MSLRATRQELAAVSGLPSRRIDWLWPDWFALGKWTRAAGRSWSRRGVAEPADRIGRGCGIDQGEPPCRDQQSAGDNAQANRIPGKDTILGWRK
jgi:hypothetical protein